MNLKSGYMIELIRKILLEIEGGIVCEQKRPGKEEKN